MLQLRNLLFGRIIQTKQLIIYKWVSSRDYGTYHTGDQRWLRCMEADKLPTKSQTASPTGWLRMHVFKNEFMEEEKYQNCMSWLKWCYHKNPKKLDTRKIAVIILKFKQLWLYHRIMSQKDANRMANSVDPDQNAPLGAVWSGSTLFAQTCLSENLGILW